VREITSCEFILSSSLHGLVVADSYGIPNQWVEPAAEDIHNTFKFYDYYSALELPTAFKQGPTLLNQRPNIEELLKSLSKSYARHNIDALGDKLISAFPEQLLGRED
jgi:pyruvyltransferase